MTTADTIEQLMQPRKLRLETFKFRSCLQGYHKRCAPWSHTTDSARPDGDALHVCTCACHKPDDEVRG